MLPSKDRTSPKYPKTLNNLFNRESVGVNPPEHVHAWLKWLETTLRNKACAPRDAKSRSRAGRSRLSGISHTRQNGHVPPSPEQSCNLQHPPAYLNSQVATPHERYRPISQRPCKA